MMRLMNERSEIRVVADQTGRPTFAPNLARFIIDLLLNTDHRPPGIYHFANKGAITWHTFATAIRDRCGYSCSVIPITSAEFPTPARRPHYSILNTDLTEQTFGIQIPDWTIGLQACLHQLREPNQRF
jgi:dTDP-4-dehydrorhamnose reductase